MRGWHFALTFNSILLWSAALTVAAQAQTPNAALSAPAAGTSLPSTAAEGESSSRTSASVGGLNVDMKLDDLVKQDVLVPALTQVVDTVDRQESTVGRSPAAVFVITQEMIKRSGVRTIADALRMAPGIEVAKIDASTWAITARGFNGRFANKLLVQIDRRVVYTPTYGGVYWDMQDLVLADIERIEVIRGPGTTTWGSNAVNGVINIITKNAKDTQGVLTQNGGGTQELDFNTVRYGARSGDMAWRAWGQQWDRNSGWSDSGINDQWRQQRGGFRADWTPTKDDAITLQGDIFNGYDGQRFDNTIPTPPFSEVVNDRVHVSGGDVLMRYNKVIDDDTGWQAWGYYDRYQRNFTAFAETRDTYNLDFQYQFSPWEFHKFIAGANYRNSPDNTRGGFSFNLVPPAFTTQWASLFVEDTMALEEDRWYLTLGTRLEQNTFGHFQVEPTARLLFLPSKRQSAWAAISRAVRNPTRIDAQGSLVSFTGNTVPAPTFANFLGNPNIAPENMMSYEIGYREAPTDNFSWDIAGYINDYRMLQGFSPPGPPVVVPPGYIFIPLMFQNNTSALSYGFEVTSTYKVTDRWKMFGSYSLFEVDARGPDPIAQDQIENNSAHNMIYLQSSWDGSYNMQYDLIARYMDAVTGLSVPKYIEMDARISWRPGKNLECSFIGQNLLNPHHLEYRDDATGINATEVRRGWYGMITWTY